ncbi:SH3 domain-containing protein [Jiella marina]|uniref:SH3 domain-containing protein n=1 Tax=Jiella sp. LLJ827 TaxID=2917712 RepID=UPI002100C33C|nr:SH3 domain-containing protein [Jiella sp. LLJ827]MCQ0989478.1 SH3 domain-containing protein [Jiella sp. LLJ827]
MRWIFAILFALGAVALSSDAARAQAYAQEWQASVERWLYGLESRTATAECVDRLKNRAITFIGIAEDEPRIGSGRRRDLNSLIAAAIPDKYTPRLGRAYRQMVEGILPQRASSASTAQALKDFFGSDMFLTVEPERRLPEILRLYLGLTILDPETGRICATETGPTLTLDLNRLGVAELSDTFSSREFYDVDGALREASLKAIARLQQHGLLKDTTMPLAYRVTADVDASECQLARSIDDTFNSAYTELSGSRQQRINETVGATAWPLLRQLPAGEDGSGDPAAEGVFLDIAVAPAPEERLDGAGESPASSAVLKLDVSARHANGTNIGRYSYRVVVPRSEVRNCLPETVASNDAMEEEGRAGAGCAALFEVARGAGTVSALRDFIAGNAMCQAEVRQAELVLDSAASTCATRAETAEPEVAIAMLDQCAADFSGSLRHEIALNAARDRAVLRQKQADAEADRLRREAELREKLEEEYKRRLAEIEERLDAERRQREEAERRAAEARANDRRAWSEPQPARDRRPRCVVADPTNTPLNVRTAPGNKSRIINTLRDGHVVVVLSEYPNGRPWAHVAEPLANGGVRELGWVYRPYIRC